MVDTGSTKLIIRLGYMPYWCAICTIMCSNQIFRVGVPKLIVAILNTV